MPFRLMATLIFQGWYTFEVYYWVILLIIYQFAINYYENSINGLWPLNNKFRKLFSINDSSIVMNRTQDAIYFHFSSIDLKLAFVLATDISWNRNVVQFYMYNDLNIISLKSFLFIFHCIT